MATELQAIDPLTGEIAEYNLDGAEQPDAADIRQAKKTHDVENTPMAICGLKFGEGQSFTGEYAECLYVTPEFPRGDIFVTASSEIIGTLRRTQARGLCTPAKPLLCKVSTATKTSGGFFVHKLEQLTADEEKALKKALAT